MKLNRVWVISRVQRGLLRIVPSRFYELVYVRFAYSEQKKKMDPRKSPHSTLDVVESNKGRFYGRHAVFTTLS